MPKFLSLFLSSVWCCYGDKKEELGVVNMASGPESGALVTAHVSACGVINCSGIVGFTICCLVVSLVGFARIYLGMHSVIDIIGEDLVPLPWNSFGTVAVLLQEIVSIYPVFSPPNLTPGHSNRVCNALALLQCVASHPETRMMFLSAHIPLYLYPFLNATNKSRPFEYLRCTNLGDLGLQLLGVSSMLIASKYEEISPPHVDDFCCITDNTYTKAELVKMESDVLSSLKFEMGNPTVQTSLRRITRISHGDFESSSLQLEFLGYYLAE